MKTKLFVLTLFAVLFLAGIVSASFTATLDGSFSKTDNTVIMTVTSTIADTVNVGIIPAITDGTKVTCLFGGATIPYYIWLFSSLALGLIISSGGRS